MFSMKKFILASASPRRKELLKEIVQDFTVSPSSFDESSVNATLPPRKLVKELAKGKALAVVKECENGVVVLGSDTVVALGRRVLGKPRDEREAREMLTLLSGKKHAVYTGVCFAVSGKTFSAVCKTDVFFEKLSKEFIERYVQSGSPMDKAGAYGIQDGGLVKKIRGSYSNVVGLPVELCKKMLNKLKRKGLLP